MEVVRRDTIFSRRLLDQSVERCSLGTCRSSTQSIAGEMLRSADAVDGSLAGRFWGGAGGALDAVLVADALLVSSVISIIKEGVDVLASMGHLLRRWKNLWVARLQQGIRDIQMIDIRLLHGPVIRWSGSNQPGAACAVNAGIRISGFVVDSASGFLLAG